jgi:hypothetical protein
MMLMQKKFVTFASDQRGNVGLIAAGTLGVMMMLGAGATDIARVNKIRSSMQSSADTALLTSLRMKESKWEKRVQFASNLFKENFSYPKMVTDLTGQLSGEKKDRQLIFSFKSSAKITQWLPDGLSFAADRIEVDSMAIISKHTNYEPRLISNSDGRKMRAGATKLR